MKIKSKSQQDTVSVTIAVEGKPAHKQNKVFQKLGHDCDMPAEPDEIEAAIPGKGCCAYLKRKILSLMLVNEKICKICAIHLRSHGAVEKEKKRQLSEYNTTIHPFSTIRIGWEIFMVFICLAQLIIVPCDLAYYSFNETMPFVNNIGFFIVRFIIDVICCIDIFVNAITGYYDESRKEIVLNHRKILLYIIVLSFIYFSFLVFLYIFVFSHYFKNRFIWDFISAVPTHWDLFFKIKDTDQLMMILQCFSMVKYTRYFVFTKYVTNLSNIFHIDFYVRHGFLMIMTLLIYWHILSCTAVFGYVALNDLKILAMYQNTTPFTAIATSLYDGALLIYTASYGIHEPENNYQFIMTNVLWFLSKFVQIFLLARVIEFLKAKTSPKMKYSQMVKQLVEFMRHKQLPLYTQKRILTYYEFHYQKSYFRESEIYATISGQLRQEIVMQTCRQLVENVEFFRDLPLSLLVRIVTCLKSEIYLTNDVIVKAATPGDCMYFISSGTVAVYSLSGKEVCHLEDGSHFGEIALVNVDSLRIASVIAVEVCELYRLDRKDFIKAIHPYPDLLEKINKIAADRSEKTAMLDEHNKREVQQTKRY